MELAVGLQLRELWLWFLFGKHPSWSEFISSTHLFSFGCVILTWLDMSPSVALLNLSKHWKVTLANQRNIGYIVNLISTHGYQSGAVVRGLSDISVMSKNLWYGWFGVWCWTSWCQGTWSMVWFWFGLFNVVALRKVKICFGSFDLFYILYFLYYQWQPPLLLTCIECSWVPRIKLSFPLSPNSHFNSQAPVVHVLSHMLERFSCGLQQIPAVRFWVTLEWKLKLGLSLWHQVLNLPSVLLSCTKMTWETIHSKASLLNVSHIKLQNSIDSSSVPFVFWAS